MALRAPLVIACLAILLTAGGSPLAADSRWDRGGERGRHGEPAIIVEPTIDLTRPRRPDRNAPDVMMANIEGCAANGVRFFVDCLRGRASPIAIRRLEECLRSESIPEDLAEVAACLPGLGPYRN